MRTGWLGGLVLAVVCATPSAADEPWPDTPPFSIPADQLLAKVSALPKPEKAGTLFVLDEASLSMAADGRQTNRRYSIYLILKPEDLPAREAVQMGWSPWREDRPELRARVVTPDGVEHWLDPSTIAEGPAAVEEQRVYSDRRVVKAPLPAVAVGAIVEVEIRGIENAPYLEGGNSGVYPMGRQRAAVRTSRVVIEAPEAVHLVTVPEGPKPLEPRRETLDGKVRLTFEGGPYDPVGKPEMDTPTDHVGWPAIAYTTFPDWAEVARRYDAVVEGRLQASALDAWVKPLLAGKKTRDEKLAAVVAALHREIRYTGIEFGQASIVPAAPSETLRRKYGDCKDKSTLLVAMLRVAGFRAHVALLGTSSVPDADPRVPGITPFNHAIVRVDGDPPVWIDATDASARPGVLRPSVEGRLALVAASGVQGLERLPELTSEGAGREQRVDFRLKEFGPGEVEETETLHGYLEAEYRDSFRGREKARVQEWLESYATAVYGSGTISAFDLSDAGDFEHPFRVHLVAADAKLSNTGDDGAVVAVRTYDGLNEITRYLEQLGLPPTPEGAKDPPESDRRTPLRVSRPYRDVRTYRIHPPPGFIPVTKPEDLDEAMGPVRVHRRIVVQPDGIVEVRVESDTGARTWSPSDVDSARRGIARARATKALIVQYESVGYRLRHEGRFRDAISEYRRLAALHPAEALHRAQIAYTLLDGGLGEAARAEARAATVLEPAAPAGWRALGWALIHDAVGRQFRRGCDLAEAERALRKAKEIDPSEPSDRRNLAVVLEYGKNLERYEDPAALGPAIEEWKALARDLKSHDYDLSLLICLFHAERFSDLASLALTLPDSADRDVLHIAAVAAASGPEAAQVLAATLAPDAATRQNRLAAAAQQLLAIRHYAEAAALMRLAAEGGGDPSRVRAVADLLARVRRHEAIDLDADDPVAAVKRTVLSSADSGADPRRFIESLSSLRRQGKGEADLIEEARAAMRAVRSRLADKNVSIGAAMDLLLTLGEWRTEDDGESGHRVAVELSLPGASQALTWYTVREDGAHRLVAVSNDVEGLGLRALQLANAQKATAGAKWLDWALDDAQGRAPADPLEAPSFLSLWRAGSPRDPDAVRRAAAALAADSAGAGVEEALRYAIGAESDPPASVALRKALVAALAGARRFSEAATEGLAVLEARPDSVVAFRLAAVNLVFAGRLEEAARIADARLATVPDDPAALRVRSMIAARRGKVDDAAVSLERMAAIGKAEPEDLNNLAWFRLLQGRTDDDTIELGRKAALYQQNASPAALNTLAAIYAAAGRSAEALEMLRKRMDLNGEDEPDDADWLVVGLLAESYRETAAAAGAYHRVRQHLDEQSAPTSPWAYAQRRLAKLGAPAGSR